MAWHSAETPSSLLVVLAVALGAVAAVIPSYRAAEQDDVIRRGPGRDGGPQAVDVVRRASAAPTATRTSTCWTPASPARRALVLGGTHGNEPAGYMTAILIVEHAVPTAGQAPGHPAREPVVGDAHGLPGGVAAGARVPGRVRAPRVPVREPGHEPDRPVAGSRHLRACRVRAAAVGRRDAEPQPRVSRPAGRHVHRAGGLRHRVARPIAEKVDLVIDLHEASPEYPVVNAIVAHERAMPVASAAVLNLEFDDIKIGLEPSPKNLRGLSHRELGDATEALAHAVRDVQRVAGPAARRDRRAAGRSRAPTTSTCGRPDSAGSPCRSTSRGGP